MLGSSIVLIFILSLIPFNIIYQFYHCLLWCFHLIDSSGMHGISNFVVATESMEWLLAQIILYFFVAVFVVVFVWLVRNALLHLNQLLY